MFVLKGNYLFPVLLYYTITKKTPHNGGYSQTYIVYSSFSRLIYITTRDNE